MKRFRAFFLLGLCAWGLFDAAAGPPTKAEPAPEILPRPTFENCFLLELVGGHGDFPETNARTRADFQEELREFYRMLGPQRLYARVGLLSCIGGGFIYGEDEDYREHGMSLPIYQYDHKPKFLEQFAGRDVRSLIWSVDGKVTFLSPFSDNTVELSLSRYADSFTSTEKDSAFWWVRRYGTQFREMLDSGAPVSILAMPRNVSFLFALFDGQGYEPPMVAEFRDYLAHRGRYAPGAPYEKDAWTGGEGFADDPSPAKAQGKNKSFNATFGTDFKTWELKYWDLDRFPGHLAPGTPLMPKEGEKGHIAGGFDAPRKVDDPLFPCWQGLGRAKPGFRQLVVWWRQRETQRILHEECGVPKERIFNRCTGLAHRRFDVPGLYPAGKAPSPMNARGVAWEAITPYGCPGWVFYGPAREKIEGIRLSLEEEKRDLWAITEHHPFPGDPFNHSAEEYLADLRAIWDAYPTGPRFLGLHCWQGDRRKPPSECKCQIKGTPCVEAVRRFLADLPDAPYPFLKEKDAKPYLPPSVRGLTARRDDKTGDMELRWEERIWEGDVVRWADWSSFQEFEAASCGGLTPEGAPIKPRACGKTAAASFAVPKSKAGSFLCVRAVSKEKLKGAWTAVRVGAPESGQDVENGEEGKREEKEDGILTEEPGWDGFHK